MGQIVPRPDDTLERKLRDHERRLSDLARSSLTVATTFPDEPFDKQEVLFLASPTAGIVWHFRYRADSTSLFKWEAVGSQEGLFTEVVATEATTFVGSPTSYTNLTTVGPIIQIPLTGEYRIEHGAAIGNTAAATSYMSYLYDGVNDALDAHSARVTAGAGQGASVSRRRRITPLLAGAVVVARYRVSAGTGVFADRWIDVRPLRVAV